MSLLLRKANRVILEFFAGIFIFATVAFGGTGSALAVTCGSGQIDVDGTCVSGKFAIKTTNLSNGDTFKFRLSAAGTFTVDCGENGILTTGSNTISRTSNTTDTTYTCTYSEGGEKIITFDGTATGYNTSTTTAAIRFGKTSTAADSNVTPDKIALIAGDLSALLPYLGSASGKAPRFIYTFGYVTGLTELPAELFSGIRFGTTSMFGSTFRGCTGLTSIPAGLFSNVITGATQMFQGTFYGCTGLTSIPEGLFSGIRFGYSALFSNTFAGCTNITGYIPPSTFAGLIARGSPTASSMWANTFDKTGLKKSCDNGYTQYVTGYEGSVTGTTWNGVISCVPDADIDYVVTYDCDDGTQPVATQVAISGLPFVPAPANICSSSGPVFSGWAVSGTTTTVSRPFIWNYSGNKTFTAQWIGSMFELETINLTAGDTFQFSLAAQGTFYVSCGDGGTLTSSASDVTSGNNGSYTITRSNTNSVTYTCTYSTDGAKTITFDSNNVSAYNTSTSTPSISFYQAGSNNSAAKIAYVHGNLSALLPQVSTTVIPRFIQTFQGATGLTSLPDNLFAGYTAASTYMFIGTFSYCTGLTSIPGALFSSLVGGAKANMFTGTFSGCTGLTSIPGGLFISITGGANYTFSSTFSGCTGLTSIPEGLFSGITAAAKDLFSTTFAGCTNITGYIPPSTFAGLIANGHPTTSNMWGNTFPAGVAESCPYGTTQYITGYEGTNPATTWNGKVSCKGTSVPANITYVMDGGTNYSGAPTTYYETVGATIDGIPTKAGYTFVGWCTDSGLTSCAMTQTIGTDATGDKTYYAKWSQCTACAATNASCELSVENNTCTYTTSCNTGYDNIQNNGAYNASCSALTSANITYVMDGGTNYSGAPTTYYETVGATIDGTPTKSGYIFFGWCTDSALTSCAATQTIGTDATGNKTFYAKWSKFAITTTNLWANDTFKFTMTAQGTFTVDCGADGTLTSSANDVTNGNTITRSNTTIATYTCTYTTGGVKTIAFDGLATNYSTAYQDRANNYYAAIAFSGMNFDVITEQLTPIKIASVAGNLSAIFPYISGNSASGAPQPRFYGLFGDATNLTTVPDTLFADYTTGAEQMFSSTFQSCTGLTSIPAGLFSGITTGASNMFSSTFRGCTGLTSIPAGLFSGITTGASNMFYSTFYGCTGLTSIPAGLFSGIKTGASYMFDETFYGCTGLTSIPAGLFSGIKTGASYMFDRTFYGCTGLTSIPAGLFSGITTGADYMFDYTFYRCTNLSGYIPPSTFAGLIANGSPTAENMWNSTFINTQVATTCSAGTTQYITGYEGDTSRTTWNGKVSCVEDSAADTDIVTYSCGDGTGNPPANQAAVSGETFIPAENTCTKSGAEFAGWAVSGTNEVLSQRFAWNYSGDKTFTAQWISGGKFEIKTTNLSANDTFKFNMTAQGTFTVNCGDDGTLTSSANDVTNGNTVTRNNVTQATYTCTYTTGGVKTITFDGTATNYSTATQDSSNNYYAAIAFSGTNADVTTEPLTPTKIASVSGNLSAIFPYVSGNAANGAQPRFYRLFNGATNLTAIPDTLFADYTNGASSMFGATFRGCTGLTSIPAGLFSKITTGASSMFYYTFNGCTGLTSIPAGLFSKITTGASSMFYGTFYGCTGLTLIPENLFFPNATSVNGATYMFYHTFYGCTGLTSIPAGLFSKITTGASSMFRSTFYGCTNLSGYIPPSTFAGLIANGSPTAENMWNSTFINTQVATSCPSGTTQYITGYEGTDTTNYTKWNGKVSCAPGGYITYVMDDGTNYSGAPTTYYETVGATIDGVPTKAGYTFVGWCTDSGLTSCAMTQTIGTDATGDKTYYAKWSQCTACAATNANCELTGVVNNECTYTTSCNTGYGNIQNDGAYNASCSALTSANITYVMDGGTNYSDAPTTYYETVGATIDGVPTKAGYTFVGWCTDSGLTSCAMTQTIGTDATGDKTYYAKWSQCTACAATNASCELSVENNTCTYTTSCNTGYDNIQNNGAYNASCSAVTYNITYTMDGGTNYAGAPATYTYGTGATIDGTPTKSGYAFLGWCTDSALTSCAKTQTIGTDANGDKTFYAKWMFSKFDVSTTNLSDGDTFQFTLSAAGTFTVDCGDGGTLYGSGVSGSNTITRNNTNSANYACIYTTGGVKTITFDSSNVSGYSTSEYTPAISFARSVQPGGSTNSDIVAIDGDLSALFPELGTGSGQQPRFSQTFYGQVNLTSIPAGLFSGINHGASNMFMVTFAGCTSLTSIPAGLFANITTGGAQMFSGTFMSCTGLTSIPENLFFPNALAVPGSDSMFAYTFQNCTGLTSIPAGLFSKITTGANQMFYGTFAACTSLTSIPANLFSGITTAGEAMFASTFGGCSSLSGYIPPSTFGGLILSGSPTATNMWYSTFSNSQLATSCPSGTIQYTTGYEGEDTTNYTLWNGYVSCAPGGYITYVMNGGTNYSGAPTTYYETLGATIDGVPTKSGYTFVGWCTDSGLTSCAATQTIGTDATGDKTYYAKWSQCTACAATNANCELTGVVNNECTYTTSCNTGYDNIQNDGAYNASCSAATYNITYTMDDGTNYAGAPATYTYGTGATIDGTPTKAGYTFVGWCTDSGLTSCAATQTIGTDATGDKTYYAKWISGKFNVSTTNLSANDTFKFNMTAQGTFTVDCGENGTLTSSANDVTNGNTITRNNVDQATYTCTYTTGGVKTITFDGTATNYSTGTVYQDSGEVPYAAISFSGINAEVTTETLTPTKIASVSGNLSAIFPYISANAATGAQPRFVRTFYSATNLTAIPDTLFADYTTGASYMFASTFYDCRSLQSIPAGLFSNFTTGASRMFNYTFRDCTSLQSIPAGLFSGITTGASYMFRGTFYGCTGLTSIPAGLFSGITTGASYMFRDTFRGCTGLTSIPAGLFSGITTSASHMFRATFQGCTGLTSIPENLFFPTATSVTGKSSMFYSTFNGCTGLTSIPAGLFSKITTGAASMFSTTFNGCTKLAGYIPPSTFAGLIANGSPTAENMWNSTFTSTQVATSCPSGTMPYITGYEGTDATNYTKWNGRVSCQDIVPVTCDASEYLSATDALCHVCTNDNYCPGGTYTYNGSDLGINQCPNSWYSPAGMSSADQCGRILHIGDNVVYLRSVKKTTPSLHVKVGNNIFYGNATTSDVPMHAGTERKLKVRYGNNTYSIYDDSVSLGASQ